MFYIDIQYYYLTINFQTSIFHNFNNLGLIGGSWIYGKVDDKGEFTGHNVAYVNQDLRTLYIGTFENGLMVCILDLDALDKFQLP